MIKKFSIYTFLLLFLISCSQYQSEYREDAINEHKNIYGFSNLDLATFIFPTGPGRWERFIMKIVGGCLSQDIDSLLLVNSFTSIRIGCEVEGPKWSTI